MFAKEQHRLTLVEVWPKMFVLPLWALHHIASICSFSALECLLLGGAALTIKFKLSLECSGPDVQCSPLLLELAERGLTFSLDDVIQ